MMYAFPDKLQITDSRTSTIGSSYNIYWICLIYWKYLFDQIQNTIQTLWYWTQTRKRRDHRQKKKDRMWKKTTVPRTTQAPIVSIFQKQVAASEYTRIAGHTLLYWYHCFFRRQLIRSIRGLSIYIIEWKKLWVWIQLYPVKRLGYLGHSKAKISFYSIIYLI